MKMERDNAHNSHLTMCIVVMQKMFLQTFRSPFFHRLLFFSYATLKKIVIPVVKMTLCRFNLKLKYSMLLKDAQQTTCLYFFGYLTGSQQQVSNTAVPASAAALNTVSPLPDLAHFPVATMFSLSTPGHTHTLPPTPHSHTHTSINIRCCVSWQGLQPDSSVPEVLATIHLPATEKTWPIPSCRHRSAVRETAQLHRFSYTASTLRPLPHHHPATTSNDDTVWERGPCSFCEGILQELFSIGHLICSLAAGPNELFILGTIS